MLRTQRAMIDAFMYVLDKMYTSEKVRKDA